MAIKPAQSEAEKQRDKAGAPQGTGQKTSQERGSHTHHKKSPGKRPHQGGS